MNVRGGALLLYHLPLIPTAATISEHVGSFATYSRFPVWTINTELGMPQGLPGLNFDVVILHYSLFGLDIMLDDDFRAWLRSQDDAYIVAFFQDEYRYCSQRFAFVNDHRVRCIFTLLKPDYHQAVYGERTNVDRVEYTLPGYVSESMSDAARKYAKVDRSRTVDVGYRARRLPYYMGRGAQEKHEIAERFVQFAPPEMTIDIAVDERSRLYGSHWYRFLGNCKAVLGVEAGTSIFDVQDVVIPQCERFLEKYPDASFDDVEASVLFAYEDKIPYRTVSPRHFEAAAFRCCQVLFKGEYSGVLEPMRHYIPLEKDFSNIDDVFAILSDPRARGRISSRCFNDVIVSKRYHYSTFIAQVDSVLNDAGVRPPDACGQPAWVSERLERDRVRRRLRGHARAARYRDFPGRDWIKRGVHWARKAKS